MKDKIKKMPIIGKILKKIKSFFNSFDFVKDKRFFLKNYNNKLNTISKIEYSMLLQIHGMEKGMASSNIRPFGYEKVNNILNEVNPILQLMNEDDIHIKIYINKNVGYVLNFGDEKIIWNNN